jgi:hypothetical protein
MVTKSQAEIKRLSVKGSEVATKIIFEILFK